jgi:hypothetical protein
MVLEVKLKKDNKTTVVPTEKKGAENIITKKKVDFKEVFKNILNAIKKGFGKVVSGVKKGFGALVSLCKNHKKASMITGAVLLVVLVAGVLIPTLSKPSTEKEMKNKLNMLGVTFYEDFYWKSAGNGDEAKRKEFLAKYEQLGIKVSLENLIRYYVTTDKYKELDIDKIDATIADRVADLEKEWFEEGKYKCDGDNTKVVIYPQDPFDEGNYKLELVTACGFKDEDTSETTTKKKETTTTQAKIDETTKATKKTKKK